MAERLPDALVAALGRWHLQPVCNALVTQLELYGEQIEVRRLTLGDPHAPGFGTLRTVYRTGEGERP